MQIKVIEVGYLQTNCYFVIDENTMDAAVIDPGDDSNKILDAVEQGGYHIKAILLTHGHFDHCMGLDEVYAATHAPVYMSHKDLQADVGSASFGLDWELDPPEDDTHFVSEGVVPQINEFRSRRSVQLVITDLRAHRDGGQS